MAIVTSVTGNSTPASAVAGSPDWRTATTDLITWLVANKRAFSSGEITAYLRTSRPDLAFAATKVGDFVREHYDNGLFPSYDDGQGSTIYPTQVPRTTIGTGRTLDGRQVTSKTQPGMTVFVYALDGAEGFAHDFEVYIPDYDDPDATRAQPITAQAAATAATLAPAPVVVDSHGNASQKPSANAAVVITGRLQKDDLIASVRPDRRLCVPRAALEAFVGLTGIPLRGGPQGDPVHITFDGDVVEITRDVTLTSTAYHLWSSRGRVAFLAAVTPFEPGDKYEIKVTGNSLTIDLSKKV